MKKLQTPLLCSVEWVSVRTADSSDRMVPGVAGRGPAVWVWLGETGSAVCTAAGLSVAAEAATR